MSVRGWRSPNNGPGDLGLSYGYLEGRADPPLPPEVVAAGGMVLGLTKERGIFFLDSVLARECGGTPPIPDSREEVEREGLPVPCHLAGRTSTLAARLGFDVNCRP